jgi:hypothetical protein
VTDYRYDYTVEMYGSTLTVLVLDRFENVPDFHDAMRRCGIKVTKADRNGDKGLFPCRALTFKRPFKKAPRPGASLARVVVVITQDTDIELLAHEATHAALFLSKWHGLPVSLKAKYQEPLAYLVGHLTSCLVHAQEDAAGA